MKQLLGVLAALMAVGSAQAQQPTPVASTIFLNYWSEPVPQEQAAYRVRRTETPGTSRLDSVYRLTSPRLWNVQSTRWQANGDILITTTHWRPDGRP